MRTVATPRFQTVNANPMRASLKSQTIALVREIQARRMSAGSCASKHARLAEELASIGIVSVPLFVVGQLVPEALAEDPELAPGAHLPEVHECLTIMTPWPGRCGQTSPGIHPWSAEACSAHSTGTARPTCS